MERVLEIGHYAAGFCGKIFAQNQCDVVRVDSSDPPAWASNQAMNVFLHSGKRVIDCCSKESLKRLASKADILVLEAPTSDLALAWDVDEWDTPVKVVITPFGLTGPKRNWKATPSILLAMGGYTNLMGDEGKVPLSLPGHYVDFQSGQFAYIAANAVRYTRQSNLIDVGMLESVMALSQFTTVQWTCADHIRSRHGNDFWWVVPTNMFQCADGWVFINIVPTFWEAFAVFLGKAELLIDPRFETNNLRMTNRDSLHQIIRETVASIPKSELRARANESRIPLGVVQSFAEIMEDPHLNARDYWRQVDGVDRLQIPDLPFRVNGERRGSLVRQRKVDLGEVWVG